MSDRVRKKILLLINPKARTGSNGADDLSAALEQEGHNVVVPDKMEDFRTSIRRLKDQVDLVIVGGGDGTINCVLPVLVETKLPLIVYPMGTANLLARSFNIKPDIKEILDMTCSGVSVPIDLGMVNGIYFINVCGLGISTEVNKSVSPKLKKITGPFSFWIQGLKLFKHLEPFKIKLTVDDEQPITTRTWQITVCNGRKYAAWMTIQPDASYDDGMLRCLSTEITKWWEGFKLLPSYIKGSYSDDLSVSFKAGKRIKIESKKPLLIDVDGDVQTSTPAVFEVHPSALNIILPQMSIVTDTPISESPFEIPDGQSINISPVVDQPINH